MMLIAIASADDGGLEGQVSAHFGRSTHVTLVEVEDDQICSHWVEKNPNTELHQPGTMPLFIRALGASVVLSGGMGPRAVKMFRGHGIEVATGTVGSVRLAVEDYLRGKLKGVAPCKHSEVKGCVGHDISAPLLDERYGKGPTKRHTQGTWQCVAIAAQDDSGLTAAVDPKFGRAPYFVLVDLEAGEVVNTLLNTARSDPHRAEVAAAMAVVDGGARIVIAGSFGPRTKQALLASGVAMWTAPVGVGVDQTLERLKAGELTRLRAV